MIAIIFLACCFGYILINVIYILFRNYRAHQFFRLKCPQLPVIPKPNIFYGNTLEVTWPNKNYKIITAFHEMYGNSFGYYMCEQPWVSTKDLDLIKLIEVDKAHKHINRSKFGLPLKEFNDSIFQIDDDAWRRVRRAISPALTNHKVRSDEVTSDIKHVLDQLLETLKGKLNNAKLYNNEKSIIIDVHNMFQRYTLAVIFLITYKKDNVIDFYKDQEEWVNDMESGARYVTNYITLLSIMFPFIRSTCSFLSHFHSTGKLIDKICSYIVKATDLNRTAREYHEKHQKRLSLTIEGYKERSFEELKKSGNFKRRLIDTIIDSFMDKKINYDEFVGTAVFLLLAGHHTTGSTLTSLVYHLVHQPDIQEKLRKTLQEEGIDGEYVQWCIMEAVRWHPAVPLGTGRILGEDVTVNGITYAKGTFIMPSTYSIHHDENIWPEADKYKPERWKNANEFHPASFMGFGLGPKNCVGGKLAIVEVKLVIQMLLTHFRLEKCPETSDTYEFSAPGLIYTLLDEPIKVRLVPLESSA